MSKENICLRRLCQPLKSVAQAARQIGTWLRFSIATRFWLRKSIAIHSYGKTALKVFNPHNLSRIALLTLLFACQAKPSLDVQIALKDLTPPQVTFIWPANGETEVSDKPTIVIGFNEPMDAATLSSATVTIKTANGTPAVGSYEYDTAQNVLSIEIVERLYLNTQYTITVTDRVKDRAGNAIMPVSSSFTTDVCSKSKAERPVFNFAINAIAKVGCTLYVGGNFTQVGAASAYGIPIGEDGKKAIGFYYSEINDRVNAVVGDGNGGWYIAGEFTRVGDHERYRFAHLAPNGEVLPPSPRIEGEYVTAMQKVGDVIYLAGDFTNINGIPRNGLAAIKTDGTVLPWNPQANSLVVALAVSGSTIYMAGSFTAIGGIPRNYLAAIDTDGTLLPWNPPGGGIINALAITGSTVYVGGDFTCFGNCPSGTEGLDKWTRNRLAAIDATTGSILSWNPNANNEVNTLAVSGSTVYVGGRFTTIAGITRNYLAAIDTTGALSGWNPNVSGVPLHVHIRTLAVSGSAVYVGGHFTGIGCTSGCSITGGPYPRSHLAAISTDGSLLSWNPNADNLVSTLAVSANTVYAAGIFTAIGATVRNNLAALSTDGSLLPWNPNANDQVYAMAVSQNTVYVGGKFSSIGGTTRNRLAAIGIDGALSSWDPNANNEVYALALSDNTVYVGGNFTQIGCASGCSVTPIQTRNRLAAISSAGGLLSWNPNADNAVFALAVSGNTVYAGGIFTCFGASCTPGTRNRLAAINATTGSIESWNPNANSTVYALAVSGNTVYTGGNFSTIGGTSRNFVAAISIDSNCLIAYSSGCLLNWNPGTDSIVYTLAASGSTVYAGGFFNCLGDCVGGTEGITKWSRNALAAIGTDGTVLPWNPNADSLVNAVVVSGRTLYIGGAFGYLGGNTASKIASVNTDGTVNW